MNATSSAGASRKSSGDTSLSDKSGRLKPGTAVPSGSIVDGVRVMFTGTPRARSLWSAKRERQLDRDEHGNGFTLTHARLEAPLLRGLHRFLIEAERRIERSHDFDRTDAAIGEDDALEQHGALHLGTHRLRGVLRLHFVQNNRKRDAIARPHRAATRAAAGAGSQA